MPFLDTGADLATIAAALAAFGGVGYVGARAAAIARLHVEERRVLIDEQVIDLAQLWTYQSADFELGYEMAKRLAAINRRVELLPWTDRATWRRVLNALPEDTLHEMLGLELEAERLHRLAGLPNAEPQLLVDRKRAHNEATERWALVCAARSARGLDRFTRAADDFVEYVEWTLRPTPLRRLKVVRHQLDLLRHGPRRPGRLARSWRVADLRARYLKDKLGRYQIRRH